MTDEELLLLPANCRSVSVSRDRSRPSCRASERDRILNMFLQRNNSLPVTRHPLTPQATPAKQPDLSSELRKSQMEKEIIRERLKALRSRAVSSLIEKSQSIDKLREQLQEAEHCGNEEQQSDQSYECSLRLEQATQNIERLKRQVLKERESHLAVINKKDRIIIELGEELDQSRSAIGKIEQSTEILALKIRETEGNNETLQDELLRSKSNISVLRQSLRGSLEVHNTSNIVELGSQSQFSDILMRLATDESQQQQHEEIQPKEQNHHHLGERLRQQLDFNKKERDQRKREILQCHLHYQALLAQQNQLKPRKGYEYPTAEQLSERSYEGSNKFSYNDLRNEIKMIENHPIFDLQPLERRCASSVTDNESEFSLNHFNYHREDESGELDSQHFPRSKIRLAQKESAPNPTHLDDISEASIDVSMCKSSSKWSPYRLLGIAAGVLATAVIIRLAVRLCR